jgi:hypothetical protein
MIPTELWGAWKGNWTMTSLSWTFWTRDMERFRMCHWRRLGDQSGLRDSRPHTLCCLKCLTNKVTSRVGLGPRQLSQHGSSRCWVTLMISPAYDLPNFPGVQISVGVWCAQMCLIVLSCFFISMGLFEYGTPTPQALEILSTSNHFPKNH